MYIGSPIYNKKLLVHTIYLANLKSFSIICYFTLILFSFVCYLDLNGDGQLDFAELDAIMQKEVVFLIKNI